jgi:hypothetical protein
MSLADKLKEQGLSFDETDSGMLRGGFQLESGRKQLFFLDPEADDYVGYAEHDFTSIVGPADDPAKLRAACEMAGSSKRGAIVVIENMIMLKYEIPSSLDGPTMLAQVESLCATADKMELEIFEVDQY